MKKFKIIINPYIENLPILFDNFLISLHDLQLLDFSLSIEKDRDKVAYFGECGEEDYLKVCSLIESFFENFEVVECLESSDSLGADLVYFKLKNLPFYPVKRYDQFEDKLSKVYVDPIVPLIKSLDAVQDAKLIIRFKSVKSNLRVKLLKVFYLCQFLKWGFLQSWLTKVLLSKWGSVVLYFFRNSIESEVTKNHNEETVADSIVDKVNKNLFWVQVALSRNLNCAYLNQFNLPHANGFRRSKRKKWMLLNTEEIASVFHFPYLVLSLNVAKIQYLKFLIKDCLESSEEGIMLKSENESLVKLPQKDRAKHTYLIGKTGMGKSTLLKQMIYQDISANRGVGVIDPHGDLIAEVRTKIPQERVKDLVVIDFLAEGLGYNPLELKSDDNVSLLADNLLMVFKKIYGYSWGPRLEYFLKNAFLLLAERKHSTLLEVSRLFTDSKFLARLLERSSNNLLKDFFKREFLALNEKQRLEVSMSILNKVGHLATDKFLSQIFAKRKSDFDIASLINQSKIVLIDLSKGKIGSLNSNFLGALLVNSFVSEAFKRAFLPVSERKDFILYIDEFQNFATDSFAEILSEARKYKFFLCLVNQYLDQLSEEMQSAVLGNVANLIVFQVNQADAFKFSLQFAEKVPSNCFLELPAFRAYAKLENKICSLVV